MIGDYKHLLKGKVIEKRTYTQGYQHYPQKMGVVSRDKTGTFVLDVMTKK